tara:strand:+ start:742 stop:999 length:258 start_codon:yes stop_codon:yes gene_type:complete
MSRIERVSNILNDSKVYDKIAEALGIEIDRDSDIFREIESYFIEQYEVMDKNRDTENCAFCGNEIDEDSRYCSYECSKADNTERV